MAKLSGSERVRLACIKEAYDASTPGEWSAVEKGNTVPSYAVVRYGVGEKTVNVASGISPKSGNAAFIVNTHSEIPWLLSLIDRLAQEPSCEGCTHQGEAFNEFCPRCARNGHKRPDHYERKEADHV